MNELKAIARELGVEPVGDRRKCETWELAIEAAGGYPILRAIKLVAENSSGVDRLQEPVELAAENSLDVDRVQESIELAAENLSGVDRVQEPIELAAENSPGVDCVQELIEDFTGSELEPIKLCPCSAMPASQCDGTTAYHIFNDRIVAVPCYKHQRYKLMPARSPPGGDAMA